MFPRLTPLPLERRRDPFDDPSYVYSLKLDGFRALAFVDRGSVQFVSRRGHVFKKY